jgi:hypothetical protein
VALAIRVLPAELALATFREIEDFEQPIDLKNER